jgi:hypothetical protein
MTANRHQVAGTVQLTKSGSSSIVTLWNTAYNDKLQKDIRTPYKLWLNVPGDWTEGTFIEVVGELSVRPSTNSDGTVRTYLNSKGETITAHDLNLNNVEVLKVDIKTGADTSGIDLDDMRKYGTPLQQTIMDDNPF